VQLRSNFGQPGFQVLKRNCRLLTLLLAATGAAWAEPPTAIAARPAVYFAPRPEADPGRIDLRLVAFFARASRTLHGCFYELREARFVDALIAARERGVEVKLLVDNTSFWLKRDDGSLDPKAHNRFVQRLLDAGVEVRDDCGRSSLMHNKFCVADGRFVWTGSVNLTDTYAVNCNNALELQSPELARIYEREFDKKFNLRLFGRKAPSHASEQRALVASIPMEVLFAPEDDPMARVRTLLGEARRSIHFMQFAFTDQDTCRLLVQKFQAGLHVGGILDHRLYRSTGPYGNFSALVRAGIPVQLHQAPGLLHHKVFIIDHGMPDAVLITGSLNASSNGNDANDENILIVRDRAIVGRFAFEYNRVHEESTCVTAELLCDVKPAAGGILTAADLMIASNGVPDIRELRFEYPARWPLEPGERKGVSIWRDGLNVTQAAGLEHLPNGFLLKSPGLTGAGPDSQLEVHLRGLKVPAVPGSYSICLSVVRASAPGRPSPLRLQPTLEVLPATGREAASAESDPPGSGPSGAAPPLEGLPSSPRTGAVEASLLRDLADELATGKLALARRLVESLATGDQGAASRSSSAEVRAIGRLLRAVPPDSPIHEPARDLLRQLKPANP
jgi:phosphatidylserine/phosphatidylglycerophosphate/cardiolipin synthase-like enzyme